MKKIFILFFVLLMSTNLLAQIPDKYKEIYAQLEKKLNDINSNLDKINPNNTAPTNFAVELTVANGNRGETLLDPKVQTGVIVNLDALKKLDIKAVKIGIMYPILVNNFPRSLEYLAFYQFVFHEARKRNLKILAQLTPCFRDTLYGSVKVNDFYTGLNRTRYNSEKLQMIQTVIDSLAPDYLTMENEPSTAQMNTGLDFSVDNYIDEMKFILSNIDKNNLKLKNVLLGAGTGTWENFDYLVRLAKETDIDFLDLHVYPINGKLFDNFVFIADSLAKLYNKKLVVGENWLYKVTDNELVSGKLSYIDIYSRDIYDFWNPLDSSFINMVVKFASYSKADLVSFYWSHYFFSKLKYSDSLDAHSPYEKNIIGTQAASQNIITKNLGGLGVFYRDLINKFFYTNVNEEDISTLNNNIYGISIYPNPASEYLEISFDRWTQFVRWSPSEIKIYNTFGELVLSDVQHLGDFGHLKRIDISHLPVGLYFIQIGNYSQKFMVVR